MQKLALLDGSFDDRSRQHDIAINLEDVGDGKLSVEFLVVLELTCCCEQVKETSEQIKVVACDIRDHKYRDHIFGRCYSLS